MKTDSITWLRIILHYNTKLVIFTDNIMYVEFKYLGLN